jgi:hypothetical protein
MRSLRRRGLVVELLPNFAFTKNKFKAVTKKKLLPKKNFYQKTFTKNALGAEQVPGRRHSPRTGRTARRRCGQTSGKLDRILGNLYHFFLV